MMPRLDESPFGPAVGEQRCLDTLERVLAAGRADRTEAFLIGRAGEYTRFAGARVHQPQASTDVQLMVRAEVDGWVGRTATSDLSAAEWVTLEACRTARERAESSIGQPTTSLAAAAHTVPAAPPASATWWFDDTCGWYVGSRVQQAARSMRLAEQAGGTAAGMFGRAVTELATADDGGLRRYAAATEATGTLTVRVDDGSSCWKDLSRSADRLTVDQAIEQTTAEAARTAGRADVPDGVYDVVLGPQATGEMLGFFDAFGFTGPSVVSSVGAVANRAGEQVAASLVDVGDDATAGYGLPFPFDFEGTPKRPVAFLTAGRVGEAVTDRDTATLLGRASTGHFHIAREEMPRPVPMNIVMEPGPTTEEQLIHGVQRGLYVQRFWYARVVDPVTTTITGVSRDACWLIEDGRLSRPVAGARFTTSVFDTLARVDGVGSTTLSQPVMNVWNGAVSAPAVRVRGFRFGPAQPLGGGRP